MDTPNPKPPENPESPEGFVDLTQPREGEPDGLREKVVDAIRTCYDPEIPVNIYELGLIYDLKLSPGSDVEVLMTLTSPACPVAGSLPGEVEARIRGVEGVNDARVELTWEPTWSPVRMSEGARLELNMM